MQYTKFLKWGILAGLILALFVPFIVAGGSQWFPGMFFPYITGKNFAFRIIVEILLGLYIILAIKDPKYRPRSSLLMWAVSLFVVWVGLATILSVDPVKSFWSNFERMDGYITVLHLFAFFVIASTVLTAEKWWTKIFQISVGASAIQGLLSIFQVFHIFGLAPSSQSGVRADGTFGNATYLAVYMLFNFFITLYLLAGVLKEKHAWAKHKFLITTHGVVALIQLFVIFLTETRGAILGVVGGLIVAALYIVIFGRRNTPSLWFKSSIGVLVGVVVLAGAFFALKDTQFIKSLPGLSRLASISLEDVTTQARLFYIWPTAVEGALEKPVFGWGQENFSYVFNKNYDPKMFGQEQWFDRAHNEFLDWMVAAGIPAFLLYVSFFVLATLMIIRSSTLTRPEQAFLIGIFAAYGFNNLFVFDNLLSLMYFYLLLAFAHTHGSKELPSWMAMSKSGSDRVVAVVAPIVAVVIIGGAWMLNAPAISRAQTLIYALQANNPTTGATYTPAQRLDLFVEALAQGELGRQETVEQLFQFASNGIAPNPSIDPQIKQRAYDLAEGAGKSLIEQRKNDARLELFLGVFYAQFGNLDAALAQYAKALEHSPNKQQILFQLGITQIAKGDVQGALATFKQAYDLAPEYIDARVLYATGLYYAERDGEADALLTEGFGTVLYDEPRLLQTYMSLKMYDRAIAIWEKRVEASPTNVDTILGLAGVYFASGNISQTIATIRRAQAADPAQAAQLESIITQIQNGTLKPQ